MRHSGDKQADDEEWVHDQIENVIPELKKKYDEAEKKNSASKHQERDTGEDPKKKFKDFGVSTGSQIVSEGNKETAVNWISEYAYDQLDHHVPLEKLKERFEKSYDAAVYGFNPETDEEWANHEIDNTILKMKAKYEALKGASASKHHERNTGEDLTTTPKDSRNKIRAGAFVYEGQPKSAVDWVSLYAYEKLDHHIPLEELKEGFEKSREALGHRDDRAVDIEWVNDQTNNVLPELQKTYEANQTDSASKHHGRDAGDKPRLEQRDADYYTGTHFFPYPTSPTPNITEELKISLGDAFNEWRTNTTGAANLTCSAPCKKADAIHPREDTTSMAERTKIVEACVKSLINDPSCFKVYESTDVLKPYLAELVDKGKIKDEDGVIKKFYNGGIIKDRDASNDEVGKAFGSLNSFVSGLASQISSGGAKIGITVSSNLTGNGTAKSHSHTSSNTGPGGLTGDADEDDSQEIVHAQGGAATVPPNSPNNEPEDPIAYGSGSIAAQIFESNPMVIEGEDADAQKSPIPIDAIVANQKRNDPVHPREPNPDDSKGGLVALSQNFLDILTTAYKKYKEDLANHSDMSCPLTKENACENPNLALAAGPNATSHDERQHELERCIVFLDWHPNCLLRYETKDFIKPYLKDLADSGKIDGYAPNSSAAGNSTGNAGAAATPGFTNILNTVVSSVFGSTGSESEAPKINLTGNVAVQARSEQSDDSDGKVDIFAYMDWQKQQADALLEAIEPEQSDGKFDGHAILDSQKQRAESFGEMAASVQVSSELAPKPSSKKHVQ
jgi:hypothetical protein